MGNPSATLLPFHHAAVLSATAKLEVNLAQIAANYRALQQAVSPQTRVAATLKANAYGLGASHVAPILEQSGCRDFFVVSLAEGIQLRQVLQEARIYLLGGATESQWGLVLAHQLIPILTTTSQVHAALAFAKSQGVRPQVGLYAETGIIRNGMTYDEMASLAPGCSTVLDVRVILSHLACSDEPHSAKNHQQLEEFNKIIKLFPEAEHSLANSDAHFLGADFHHHLSRSGIALYGLISAAEEKTGLACALKLSAQIVQVRDAPAGATVGYGATAKLSTVRKLATIAFGYADGLFRCLSNRSYQRYDGRVIHFVGRVSMDYCVIDVTDWPEEEVQEGAWMTLAQEAGDFAAMAQAAETIPYELLTPLGGRTAIVFHPS
ncbi:MAG: alanine racemase [Holosporales bacterium]